MKKVFLFALAVLLLLPLTAFADYATYFDVIGDVKQLLGDDPDAAWEMSRDSAAGAAGSLAGFSCRNAGNCMICEKNHWSGEFQIILFFAEDKLSAVGCEFTAPSIQDLNYGPGMTYVGIVEDLANRLRNAGLIPADAVQQTDGNLFPNSETSAYGPVYGISANSLLQTGYNSKSASNPKFGMAFMTASGEFAEQVGAGSINFTEQAAGQDGDGDPLLGAWNMVNYYTVHEDGSPWVFAGPGSGLWGLMFGFDRMWLTFKEDGSLVRTSSLGTDRKDIAGSWKKDADNNTIIPEGEAAVLENDSVIRSCVLDGEKLTCSLDDRDGSFYAKIELEFIPPLTEEQQEALLQLLLAMYEQSQNSESTDENTNAEASDKIVLTISDNVNEAGDTVRINVKAPGADAIRLYSEGVSNPRKETAGDTIEYSYSAYTASSYQDLFYAVASYNGVWSNEKSNSEIVEIIPAKVLRFNSPEVVHSGESFSLGIYEVENVSEYDVKITDGSGNPVREVRLSAGHKQMDPLPAGEYKLTVTCAENESLTVTADLKVSDELKTGYTLRHEVPAEVSDSIVLTVSDDVVEVGLLGVITVKAAGADGIRIHRPGSEYIAEETEGDFLEYEFTRTGPTTETYVAEASYNGEWSREQSNPGSITFVPAKFLRIRLKKPVPAGEKFQIGIYEVENAGEYDVRIFDDSGNTVCEELMESGFPYLEPLSAGSYTLTVTCIGNESHSLTVELEVSDEAATGDWILYREDDEGQTNAAQTSAESPKQTETEMTQEDAANAIANTLTDTVNALNEYNLGNAYYNGNGVEKDDEKAFYWWMQAAEHGIIPAYGNVGWAYANGIGVEQNDEQSVYWWKKGAEAGNTYSQGRLGYAYMDGRGVEKDITQAIYWWETAAGQDDATPDTQFNVGYSYYVGVDVDQDFEKAVYWLQKAAEQGYADAQSLLGEAYYNGHGVEADASQAFSWWQKAAEQGFRSAQYHLGACYANGEGIEQNDEQAVYWWKESAEQGYLLSMNNLGIYLYKGLGTDQDTEQAIYWLQKAAEQNLASSQYVLGVIYGLDDSFKDMDKAKYWLELSAENGSENGRNMLNELFPEE